MAVEGLALFDALEAFHLPNMESGHQRALIRRTLGKSDQECARPELVSESTVKNHVSIAASEIAMALPTGQRLAADLRGYWVCAHRRCCLSAQFRRFEAEGA